MKTPQLPKIGGRVLKTGAAVAASLAVCKAMGIPEPVFAGVAAVICIQPTVLQSYKKGVQRLQATIIGALVGLGMISLASLSPIPSIRPIAAGIAVITAMWLCLALRWQDAVVLSATTVVVTMIHGEMGENVLVYAAERTLVTAVGVIMASLVNAIVIWPRVEDRFPKRLPQIAAQAFNEFEEAVALFCSRDLPAATAALEKWNKQNGPFVSASAELSWFRESAAMKQWVPMQHREIAPALSEIHYMIDTIHQASRTLLNDAIHVLEDHPNYITEHAQIYEIITQALRPFSDLRQAVVTSLCTGSASGLADTDRNWDSELQARFISSIRAAHRSPRDIFPLFEVAKVAMELRNYSRMLIRIKQLLLENEDILAALRRQQEPFQSLSRRNS
ncbi:MAG: aromatic acid exporter family protein [Armatimonadota bacterium]|nr:aromatic acid exporter family protein [bacterium]